MENYRPVIPVEEQFKIMADSAPVLIWIAGLDKMCYFFNAGWLRFTGRTIREEFGNGWAEGVHPEDFERCLKTYTTAFDLRESFTMEYRLRRHDGIYRWVTDNGVPRYLDDGTFAGYIGTCVDIHELLENQRIATEKLNEEALAIEQTLNEKLAASNEELAATNEEILAANESLSTAQESLFKLNQGLEKTVDDRTKELSESELRYRTLVDSAPVAIGTVTGKNLVITSANEMLLQFWGKDADILGQQLKDVISESNTQKLLSVLYDIFITGEPFYGYEISTFLERNGKLKEFFFNFIYTPLKSENGQTESVMMVAIDVTEQVQARLNVENIRARLHSMVMTAPIGMTILKGRNLIVEIANQPMFDLWHRQKEEILGKALWEVFPELTSREFPALIENVFNTGKSFVIPEILSPHPERELFIEISYDPLFDSNQVVESILVTVIDITELVNARKLLEQSESDLQAINEELLSSNEELSATNDHLEDIRLALENSMKELSASETKLRFTLNAIPQQVWTASTDGKLTWVNEVVSRDFGYDIEEIVGHGWKEFIHPEDLELCVQKWTFALTSKAEYLVEFRLRFADGNYYWHLGRAIPLVEEGGIILWLGTNTNIQIQKENEEIKDEFLSIASHELKTPLTTIKAYNQLMMRSNQSPVLESFIKKSSDQIYRLEKLITDLLDVTKINAGKMSYNMETFNLRELVETTVEGMQHTTTTHELILSAGDKIDYVGDRFRLEQVLHNFLSNAIKYSPNGKKVLVDCDIVAQNVIVSVKDFGVGIAEESLNKLFNRYYRVDNTAMRFDGLGLGLFISSEILKRHQGNFWIESVEGEGSTFFFALPISVEPEMNPIQRDDFYQDQHINVAYDANKNTVIVEWKGFHNLATIQHGGQIMLEMVKKFKATKILNDNTHVLGTWSEASDWIGIDYFPMLVKAGLKYFAWIYSPIGFSQLSAKKSIDVMTSDISTQLFTDLETAKTWLDSKS